MPYGNTRDFPSVTAQGGSHGTSNFKGASDCNPGQPTQREEASEDSPVPPPEQDLHSSPTRSRYRRGLRPARPIGTANPLTTETGSRSIPSPGTWRTRRRQHSRKAEVAGE